MKVQSRHQPPSQTLLWPTKNCCWYPITDTTTQKLRKIFLFFWKSAIKIRKIWVRHKNSSQNLKKQHKHKTPCCDCVCVWDRKRENVSICVRAFVMKHNSSFIIRETAKRHINQRPPLPDMWMNPEPAETVRSCQAELRIGWGNRGVESPACPPSLLLVCFRGDMLGACVGVSECMRCKGWTPALQGPMYLMMSL